MGALHAGHLSLVDLARDAADVVIVSVFVNPTQFGPGEDYDRYPRDLDRDAALLRDRGVDAVFAPAPGTMFPPDHRTTVTVRGLTDGLCGRNRPGHFDGVATIVAKLFAAVEPDIAVFGQKDAQQLAVIRRFTADLDFGVAILAAPIVREPDGLAMSSRNAYLSPEERSQAPVLHRALALGARLAADGETDPAVVVNRIRLVLAEAPSAEVEYVEIVDAGTIAPVERVKSGDLLAAAVRFGATRLIDNELV